MAKRQSRLTRSDLRKLGHSSELDRKKAEEWWRKNAPPQYAHIPSALWITSEFRIPQSDTELYILLGEMYPGDLEKRRRNVLRTLWGLGLLFFFLRGLYYNRAGNRVSPLEIRGSFDRAVENTRPSVLGDCAALRRGELSLVRWQERMVEYIKISHIGAGALASGGYSRISPGNWDIINRNIEFQITKLNGLSAEIAGGLGDGSICRRMLMYVQSGRATYHDIEQTLMNESGFSLYRNIVTSAETCGGENSCIAQSARGWVPIGTLVPIGHRACLSHCKCYYEYMTEDGKIDRRA